jgi:glycosyltransferase involved in cell wall biosynthesis
MKLSIITVNYNNGAGLKKTISSVLEQEFKNFEYIVIDGASTDESNEIIAENSSNIDINISEPDKGVYNAMNKGIQRATGDYLLFLNSGDHFTSSSVLQEAVKFLDGTDIVYGSILLIESEKKSWTGVYPEKLDFGHFIDGSLPHPCSFIKRSLFDKVGLYDESLKICADWRFFLDAICKHNVSYTRINQTVAVFYLDGMSSEPGSDAIIKDEKEKVLDAQYKKLLEQHNELAKRKKAKSVSLINIILSKIASRITRRNATI